MDTSALNATAVRDFVTTRLAAIAASPNWIVPTVATDIKVDNDAFQAVLRYTDTDAYHTSHPYPRDFIRRRLGLDSVWLQVVTHTMTLGPDGVKTLKEAKPDQPATPYTAPADVAELATRARLVQVHDLVHAIRKHNDDGTEPAPLHVADDHSDLVALTADNLKTQIEAMKDLSRVMLVTIVKPDKQVTDLIDKYDEQVDHCGLYLALDTLLPKTEIVTAVLIGGTRPLAIRYLAHDLVVSVFDHDRKLVVEIEERRGWWIPPSTRLVRFTSGAHA